MNKLKWIGKIQEGRKRVNSLALKKAIQMNSLYIIFNI